MINTEVQKLIDSGIGVRPKRQQWNGVICGNLLKQSAEPKRRNTDEINAL